MQEIHWKDFQTIELLRRQALCACIFAAKRMTGIRCEVIVTRAYDDQQQMVLAGFDKPLPEGARLA